MCSVSMVYDRYRPQFPDWTPQPFPQPFQPFVTPPLPPVPLEQLSQLALAELRALIAEFREAVRLAKELDRVMKQPDCEDIEKKRLEDKVAELEKRLNVLQPVGA